MDVLTVDEADEPPLGRRPNGLSDLGSPSPDAVAHVKFNGRLVIVGFGCVGAGTLPLIIKHIEMPAEKITIFTDVDRQIEAETAAKRYGVHCIIGRIEPDNYIDILSPLLGTGDYLINVSVDVGTADLLRFCHDNDVLYLDTVIEPWPGGYTDPSLTPSERSNYGQRETVMRLREELGRDGATAITTHGANPGLVSHFVKRALMNIAKDTGVDVPNPTTREEWGDLMREIGVKTIHIAERDSQVCDLRSKKVGEFVNTWSVDGFVSEGCQPSELGWGTHEKHFPEDGEHHPSGSDAAIYLKRPGCATKVRTWTPTEGPFHGFLVTHNEAISIADYFTVREDDKVVYRPTVHYAYHPCNDAILSLHELNGKNFAQQPNTRIMVDEITDGIDELGVLLCGHARGAYWYGSQLSIGSARELIESNSATSLQVTASVLAGVVWAIENPRCGIVEPEEIDWERVLEIAVPYCQPVVGKYTDWTPLQGRSSLFVEDVDPTDPWQFKNIRVA